MFIPERRLPNGTAIEFTDPWSIYEDRQAGIFSWAILGIFLLFFVGLVVKDMFAKYLGSELKEDGKNCLEILTIFLRLPVILFSKDNMRALWVSITNIFRCTANKRRTGTVKPAVVLRDRLDSAAVIERLGGGSTSSQSSGNGKEAKDKAKVTEISQIPELSEHPSSKAAPLGRVIPPFKGLPVVFEVPDILPEDRFGSGSGSASHAHSHKSGSGSGSHDHSYSGGSCDAGGGGCD
ncbi:hypothetical protein NW762_013562 [Fusarium torreyae]|uniref:Uncharacterized protein n=1 Tax=Fusarium torreyae TaxID=1237075 RepID=A0A9W8RM78_9HYPO|nr:hypothetical protein NW762_013562 [Fusarium torreyae]